MPEYYGYAERQAGSQVDWAGIGVDMSKTILAEEKIREDKRAAIDDATYKTIDELSKVPKGEEANGNRLVSDYSDNATKAMLMQHRLLKSGRLAPKDYMLFQANIKSGTNQMFSLQTEYQKQYSEKMARMKSGEAQNAESDLMANYEGYADLSKTRPVIDPKTGQVNLMIMEFDSNNVFQPTGKLTSVQGAYKGMGQKFDRFKVGEAATAISDKLANVVMTSLKEGSLTEQGQLITLDYALQEPNTVKALNNYVESYLEIPTNVSSILTNDLGGYENVFTHDETKKSSGNKIVWNVNEYGAWTPSFTKEQEMAAKDYLSTQTKAAIAKKEEVKNFESAAFDRYKLNQEDKRIKIAQQNALKTETSGGTPTDDGQGWVNFVSQRVPQIKYGATADEDTIAELNKNFNSVGLRFEQEPNSKRESIVIVDTDQDPVIKSQPISLKDPNARNLIMDYIQINKAGVGKNLIQTGVLKKNAPQSGGRFKGLDANGMPILE